MDRINTDFKRIGIEPLEIFCQFGGVNPVVSQLANGNAFVIGVGMTVIAFALRL